MPLRKLYDIAYQWVNERAGLDELIDFLRKKEVPVSRHSAWLYFGGLSLFFFMVQMATGLLLLMYYRPGADSSFESLQFIVSKVKFGWLVREVHAWSANLMIFCVFVHMFSVFFLKAYRKPREMTWMSGMLLLFLALGFGFSGYLLPWNELAFFATKVGTDMAGTVPLVGDFALKVLRGGPEVTGATLSRFFGIHVAVLPALFGGMLTVHLLLL
ncbi:MAG: cytochrome b N-terminal domain-containing protein, partial [Candidatus Glassbacteria bacterium]|nr:cytochrome b N-terminal domain-containing protein [Candidatus Glassbacteria bacterium]